MTEASRERDKRARRGQRGQARQDWATWPTYEAAVHGLPGRYWYPVMWSVLLNRKPVAIEIVNRRIMLMRDGGRAYALDDRCPHRGVPLSLGSQEFPGTISCPYHGWTFDLSSGCLRAVDYRRARLAAGREDLGRVDPCGRAARPGLGLHRTRPGR